MEGNQNIGFNAPPAYDAKGSQPPWNPPAGEAMPQGPPPPYTAVPIGFTQDPSRSTATPYTSGRPIVVQPVLTQPMTVIAGATCPACRAGVLQNSFTACGLLCCIFFFPIGMLFCMLMMERRCSNCGLTFG